MSIEERLKKFNLGDEVVFNTEESMLNAKRYRVVRKTDEKLVISHKGKEMEASPFELFTPEELEMAEKESGENFARALGVEP